MKNKSKKSNGITLIALIITVVILLILAGTAISIAINGGDIFNKTAYAGEEWNEATKNDENVIKSSLGLIYDYDGVDYVVSEESNGLEIEIIILADNDSTYKKVQVNVTGQEEGETPVVTVRVNGNDVPLSQNSFLMTESGSIYEITATTESGKTCTKSIKIQGTSQETFAAVESQDYTNGGYARIPNGYFVGASNTINNVANGLVITSAIDDEGNSTGNEYVWIPTNVNDMIIYKFI